MYIMYSTCRYSTAPHRTTYFASHNACARTPDVETGAKQPLLNEGGAKVDGNNTDGKAGAPNDGDAHVSIYPAAEPAKMSQAEVEAIELKAGDGGAGGEEAPEKVSRKREQSVLQAKLTRLTIQIGQVGTIVALLTVIVLVIRFCIENYAIKKHSWSPADFQYIIKYLIIGARVLDSPLLVACQHYCTALAPISSAEPSRAIASDASTSGL